MKLFSLASRLAALAAFSLTAAPVPVIYSTDLMHPHVDPDDHFDLACLYALPEADLRAIILDQGDRQVQCPGIKPVGQLNYLTGRHVPAAIGLRDKLKTPDDQALDQPPEHQKGMQLIIQTLQETHDKVAIIFVGSARDVVAAYNRHPGLFREKVRSIHGFIGDAGDPTHQEWNVKLDPQAFVRLMRADVPFFWIPCFDGGAWTNNGHASFWRIKHGDVLEKAPPPLQRYFLYMLRQATNDPIAYLAQPTSAEDRDWMMSGQRNLWCCALLGLAVGRPLLYEGKEVLGFSPVEVSIDNQAVVRYDKAPGSRSVMRFEIKDRARFAEAATRAAAQLLETFPLLNSPFRAVDLSVGESALVKLADGSSAEAKLLDLRDTRDRLRNAVRQVQVTVEVNGQKLVLPSADYHLPVAVGGVQVDCPITRGFVQRASNPWALDKDARLRFWPAGAPWIQPGTFRYPLRQRWFASDTQMANEPTFVNGDEAPGKTNVYYHWGLDAGGAEGLTEVIAATEGVVVSSGKARLASENLPEPVTPRYDVVYVRDARGWYYRYSHLHTIDEAIKPGGSVRMGQRVGLLGKEGGSGGWSHLHFDVVAKQPSGRYGMVEPYAFYWQAYQTERQTKLQAVARPHRLAAVGDSVTLDASRSWSAHGPSGIRTCEWTFSDGTKSAGATAERRYERPGTYSEILRVTDAEGRSDYDFAVVQVMNPAESRQLPPTIHACYWPTDNLKPGDEVTFKVRTFQIRPTEGRERWDFGDGSPPVEVQSDGNVRTLAKDGYAITTHRYARPGRYLVSVQRSNDRGETATGRLQVVVGEK